MESMIDMACSVISIERESLKELQHGFKCGEMNIQRTSRGVGKGCLVTGTEEVVNQMIEETNKFEEFKGDR